ncbi:MAG: (2Fe-2S)-binding protein [Gammaproteobacteria bacterium]|nr:(2Fe-2S)-binding protein [Gammaproteobacteria bacterium]
MTNTIQNTSDHDDVICECTGTTRGKVQSLIDDGVTDFDQISDATGACTGCGSCDILISEMLEA